LHPDAKPPSGVDRAKKRVDYLLERLAESNEQIILPAPAFAEFLVLAGADAPKYLAIIRDNSSLRVEPFDERASIQLADMEISARVAGNKRGPKDSVAPSSIARSRSICTTGRTGRSASPMTSIPQAAPWFLMWGSFE